MAKTPVLDAQPLARILDQCRITTGKGFRLRDHNPAETFGHALDKPEAQALLEEGIAQLSRLQEMLAAQDQWAVLGVLQAIDAAGKDGTIKHVMNGLSPQGVQVTSFKVPGPGELDHDFLWRASKALPARGQIGIFNRSHYEEVLVCRVHPALLDRQRLPPAVRGGNPDDGKAVGPKFWRHRLRDIAGFERYLGRQGIAVVKFFLYLSKDEQKKRFMERLDDPQKRWKFSRADLAERGFWDEYQIAYEEAIAATATKRAPWYVVPADNKWFSRLVVAAALAHTMEELKLHYPRPDAAAERDLQRARAELLDEK